MKSRTGKKKKPSKNRLDVYAKKHGLTKPDTDADGFIKDKRKRQFVARPLLVHRERKVHPFYIIGIGGDDIFGLVVTHSKTRQNKRLPNPVEPGDPKTNYASKTIQKTTSKSLFVQKRYSKFDRNAIDNHADKVIAKAKTKNKKMSKPWHPLKDVCFRD